MSDLIFCEHLIESIAQLAAARLLLELKAEIACKFHFQLCAKFPDLDLAGCADAGPKKSTTKDNSDETNDVFVLGNI